LTNFAFEGLISS